MQWLEYLGAESQEGRIFGGVEAQVERPKARQATVRRPRRAAGSCHGLSADCASSAPPFNNNSWGVFFGEVQAKTSVKSTHTWEASMR